MLWEKVKIQTKANKIVEALAPIIISASRATDIPAFYGDWFIKRIKEGYSVWRNPFNGKKYYISFQNARMFVFWSKNPEAFFKHVDFLNDKNINYYFQFTLNDYCKEFEQNVPAIDKRIDTFIKLSEKIGKEKVIWRFDPYILTEKNGVQALLRKTENIGNKIHNYTDKLVFSFADISSYKKVRRNMNGVSYTEFTEKTIYELAAGLCELNKNWKLEIASCSEKYSLEKFGIMHNKCIDDNLIIRLFNHDKELMNFLGYDADIKKIIKNKNLKDKGQRKYCNCIPSKDIGQYNTCPHACLYCYANTSKKYAVDSYYKHKLNPETKGILD